MSPTVLALPHTTTSSPADWFQAFEGATNQKYRTIRALVPFLQQICKNKSSCSFLDIGCARGLLSLKIVNQLGKERVHYCGIDAEASALAEAKKSFKKERVIASFVKGSCFDESVHTLLPDNADIILLSHVAYYAADIHDFVQQYLKKLGKEGVAVFIHNPVDSDTNQLRTKYGASVVLNTVAGIETTLEKQTHYKKGFLLSHLYFPEAISGYWDILRQISYQNSVVNENPEFIKAKHLLEFVVQQPLEELHRRGLLDAYLMEVKNKLETQENCLLVKSCIDVAVSPQCDDLFLKRFERAFKKLDAVVHQFEKQKFDQHVA